MEIRRSASRGHANHGWLDSYHSFSFNRYYDPARMEFSVLRVINEDVIAPNQGFGMHPHQDMEIITYMLGGELAHQDSLGNGSVIKAGDVQRMTAGKGIVHAEVNPSKTEESYLLQIWLKPSVNGLTPSYEDKHIDLARKLNRWCLIASQDARDDSLLIHQDVRLWATYLEADKSLDYHAQQDRSLYIQVAKGEVSINGSLLAQGDALAVEEAPEIITLKAEENTEVLVFELPKPQ
jgi:redox-sensitive bicupin YhaK (pirin superfamily)